MHRDFVAPAPTWVDPVLGAVSQGRVYALVVDASRTFVPSGEQLQSSVVIHMTVMLDGHARMFLRCQ